MEKLTYKILTADDKDIAQLAEIYRMPQVARFLSLSDNYFNYVTGTKGVYFYKVYQNNCLVGAIHLEKQQAVLFMDILVFPMLQRKGIASRIVQDVKNDIFRLDYKRIEISIDEKNSASIGLFEKLGFTFVSKEEELLNYVYNKQ